jgi:hypothetical protein
VFERAKTVHAPYREVAVIGLPLHVPSENNLSLKSIQDLERLASDLQEAQHPHMSSLCTLCAETAGQ